VTKPKLKPNKAELRSKYFAGLAKRAIELMEAGKTAMEAARILHVAPSFIHTHTRGIIPRKKWGFSGERKRVYNEWLDPNDEANIHLFWVPSPEQIAEECRKIRNGDLYIRSAAAGHHVTTFVSVASRRVSVDIFTREKRAEPFNIHGNGQRKESGDCGTVPHGSSAILRSSDSLAASQGTDRAERQQDSSTSA
jgi:hypothetical protein